MARRRRPVRHRHAVPYDNPYKALFFLSGLDFLPTGRSPSAPPTATSGSSRERTSAGEGHLEALRHGLYQPLGLKVVDGKVVVLERASSRGCTTSTTTARPTSTRTSTTTGTPAPASTPTTPAWRPTPTGNFYFFKTGDTDLPHRRLPDDGGKDGSKVEVFATGFRHPIGLGMSPTGDRHRGRPGRQLDAGDARSTSTSRAASTATCGPTTASRAAEDLRPAAVLAAAGGGQLGRRAGVGAGRPKFGPLAGTAAAPLLRPLQAVRACCRQEVDGVHQAGAVDLGLKFLSGVMRGRFDRRTGTSTCAA